VTTYRLFPSVNGGAAISYSGNFISGVVFTVSAGNTWFEGYWWWVAASNQSTAPVKCALWSASDTSHGGSGSYVVPGSVVTSATLTAGAWNYVPLPAPIQLAPGYSPGGTTGGSAYVAAIGVNGSFPDTNNYWGSGQVAPNGIMQGPLFAYSGSAASAPAPYSMAQGCFTQGGSDPSLVMPNGISGTDNFWVDVQVSDTAPAGYTGSYRVWPNKFDANAETGGDTAAAYVVATEVDLSASCALDYVHYFIPNAASAGAGLATRADVWSISSGVAVASITSPAWTTEAGGAVTIGTYGQWVRAAFAGGIVIPAGKYRVSVYNANGTTGTWNAKDATTGYWTTGGAGANGITQGPLTAPSFASAQPVNVYQGSGTTGGQPCFAVGPPDQFPNEGTGISPAQVYFVDLEVTPAAHSSGLLMASGII